MTEGNQLVGPLSGHDAGNAGDGKHISLFCLAALEERQGCRRHGDKTLGVRAALGDGLLRHIDHAERPFHAGREREPRVIADEPRGIEQGASSGCPLHLRGQPLVAEPVGSKRSLQPAAEGE